MNKNKLLLLLTILIPLASNANVQAEDNLIYIEQPCALINGAFNISDQEYNINIGRNHANQPDGSIDIGANNKQPLYGNSNQKCIDNIAIASISGIVSHHWDSYCGGHTYIRITNDYGISTEYLHVDTSADNTVPPGTVVKVGDVIGTISNKGCTGGFKHIHFTVRKNGTEQYYSQWKFGCRPPNTGDWIINGNCTIKLSQNLLIPANMIVKNQSQVIIENNTNLNIDFLNHKLLIIENSNVLIKNGSKIY